MLAIRHPATVLDMAQRDMHRVRISFYIILVFSLLSSLSSLMLWNSSRLPVMDSWVPFIPPGQHYLFQAFWTLPWMVLTYLSIAGFIYLFTCLAGKAAYHEDALMISALSVAIPYLMFWWVPEMFIIPFMGPGAGLAWPELLELERKLLFPGLWQLSLVAFGMRKLNNTNRPACLAAGALALLAFWAMYLPFMR